MATTKTKTMRTKYLFALLALFALLIGSLESKAQVSLSPFASYRVHEFGKFNGKFGGGLAADYRLNPHISLEAEVIAERFDDSHWLESLTEAGANIKIDILKHSKTRAISPYLLVGYTRNLDFDQNRMNTGAGASARLGEALGVSLRVFADGRWTQDFGTTSPVSLGHGLFRLGLSGTF